MYGLQGVPWCACFAGYVIANSSADTTYKAVAREVIDPYTGTIWERAKARGLTRPGGAGVPDGSLFIIPGKHVGLVWRAMRNGTFITLEGNSADGVRSNRRAWSDGWSAITFPNTGTPAKPKYVSGYGFDDLRVKVYGGWPTTHLRDGQMRAFRNAHPGWWTQRVRVQRQSPFAFRAGPAGTWGRFSFGPWTGKDAKSRRDEVMARWHQENPDGLPRPWRTDAMYPATGEAPGKVD
jgi:hypothetical protein